MSNTVHVQPSISLPNDTASLENPLKVYARDLILHHFPRLLTQVDRNPHSPTYGCCCRNHWHYRIEDIPNSQFQELVLSLALAFNLDEEWNPYYKSGILFEWIQAILAFWVKIQRPNGAFDEVYQGHDSFAATAFSTFTVLETILRLSDVLPSELVHATLQSSQRAVAWLSKTSETLAANQIAGAAAACYNLFRLDSDERHLDTSRKLLSQLMQAYNEEGWFNEYHGADLGYLSLTHSYLALLAESGHFPELKSVLPPVTRFLATFIHEDGSIGGEYGSRFTEYFIPLGVALQARSDALATRITHRLADGLAHKNGVIFASSFDDRYLAYLSPFYLLAALEKNIPQPATVEDQSEPVQLFNEAGLLKVSTSSYNLIANLRKGGVFRFETGGTIEYDSGFFAKNEKTHVFSSQARNPKASYSFCEKSMTVTVQTCLSRVNPITVSPWSCLAVKTFNLLFPSSARRLFLDFIRHRAVSAGTSAGNLKRTFTFSEDSVAVEDILEMKPEFSSVLLQTGRERIFSFASTGFFAPAELDSSKKPTVIRLNSNAQAVFQRIL